MTQFGVTPTSTSPAAKRIYEAGEKYASRDIAPAPPPLTPEQMRRIKAERFQRAFEATQRLSIAQIAEEVAAKHKLPVSILRARNQTRRVSSARMEAYWRCRQETLHSLPVIGKWFRRDHTTVMHGIRRHEERMKGEGNG